MKHSDLVYVLKKNPEDIDLDDAQKRDLLHMMLGISGEVGELLDAIKKYLIYEKPLDVQHVVEEMGDIEFYLEGMRQALSLNREQILQHNTEKLLDRYPEVRYSDFRARERADKN